MMHIDRHAGEGSWIGPEVTPPYGFIYSENCCESLTEHGQETLLFVEVLDLE